MPIEIEESLQHYLESFELFEKQAVGRELSWLTAIRKNAFARFWELGFPTLHHEDWRFTSLAPLTNAHLTLAHPVQVDPSLIESLALPTAPYRIVFVNGTFSPELSRAVGVHGKLSISSLRDTLHRAPQRMEPFLAKFAEFQEDAFTSLNTAFLDDGAAIHIERGAVFEEPVYVLYVSVGEGQMVNPRNLIVAEEQTQATIVEDYITVGDQFEKNSAPFFSNVVTELVADQGSVLSHYMIERESRNAINVSTLRIQQGRNTSVDSHSILVGGRLVRNNVHPVLAGEGAECLINGLFIAGENQHMDNFMKVDHVAPRCNSRQFYNGILDDHSRGVFHGRIVVHKDAQKTDAKQTNRNLLLSDDAQIDTKPQLEIYADDVKCTHGATIGQIADDALFYLRSRGLTEPAARRLLLFAFASECTDRMKPGLVRDWLQVKLAEWLPKKD